MISVYCWNFGREAGQWLDAALLRERCEQLRATSDVFWIDLDDPTPEEEALVYRQFFPVHPLTLEDVTKLRREPTYRPHFPKVEEFPNYLFVVVNPLTPEFLQRLRGPVGPAPAEDFPATQLSAVLAKKVLITHHYRPVTGVGELRAFLGRHETHAERGPDYLFHLVLDAMVDQYAPALDAFEDRLDAIEAQVFARPTPQLLQELLQVKRDLVVLRKTLVHEREVLARLSRGEFGLIDGRETVYYRNVYDHVVRFSELIESAREMASDLMQTHLSAMSNKLNEIVKVLTMISTAVLPMTLVAGIYGMNFAVLPEKDWRYGYPFALGLMASLGVGALGFFRWKKWI
jgi:magnesium transporter